MSEFQPVVLTLPESFSPTLSVEILPRGLTLHRIIVQAGGKTHDIVIGPEAPEGHVHQKYTNTIVGRYANRIPVGTHSLERKGIQSKFEAQANESPKVSLHGGPTGYDSLPWAHVKSEDAVLFTSSELAHFSNDHATHAIFRLQSADGDQGYPGKLLLEAIVALIAPEKPETPIGQNGTTPEYNLGSVFLAYRAKLNEGDKKVVTPVNLTQHWGFNLDASLREGATVADVKDHVLMVKSDRFAKLDGDALYAGFGHASDEKTHDHSAGKRIGDLFPEPRGYDDFYFLQNDTASDYPTRLALSSQSEGVDLLKILVKPLNGSDREGRPPPVVQLFSAKSGLGLTFDTNQHGVMFYSNGLASPDRGARKKIHGGSGVKDKGDAYGPATAVFLEFHEPLAAFLDPATKDGEDTLLTSDELYNNYVRCDITFKDSVPVEA